MEKWLLGGTKPSTMYVAHVVDMLLRKWFPFEGHQIIGWFVEIGCEEDEEGTVQLVISKPTPITFQDAKEAIVFMNEDLQPLHISLPGPKETKYKIIIFPTNRRPAIEGEVIKKAKKDQAA